MSPRVRAALIRLLSAIPTLFAMSIFVFALIRLVPGDPVRTMLGFRATPESIRTVRQDLGLDHSLVRQYLDWIGGALHGDLGNDYISGTPVSTLIGQALPVTLLHCPRHGRAVGAGGSGRAEAEGHRSAGTWLAAAADAYLKARARAGAPCSPGVAPRSVPGDPGGRQHPDHQGILAPVRDRQEHGWRSGPGRRSYILVYLPAARIGRQPPPCGAVQELGGGAGADVGAVGWGWRTGAARAGPGAGS